MVHWAHLSPYNPNSTSIDSAVLYGAQMWPTDRQTHKPHYFCNNRPHLHCMHMVMQKSQLLNPTLPKLTQGPFNNHSLAFTKNTKSANKMFWNNSYHHLIKKKSLDKIKWLITKKSENYLKNTWRATNQHASIHHNQTTTWKYGSQPSRFHIFQVVVDQKWDPQVTLQTE